MELWMKIAFAVMTVMSAMGFVAFIIVLKYVIPKRYYGGYPRLQSKKSIFERIDAEFCDLNCFITSTNDRLDHVVESVEDLTSKVNLNESILHEMNDRVNRHLDRLNGVEYGVIPMINDKVDNLKKRVKALKKVKEG